MDSKLITAGSAQEDEVVSRLNNAAKEGNTEAMYALLGNYPNVLENIDKICFVDTPLHLAVSFNQSSFAAEVANLKPSFAKKLNPDGFSPLHLASTYGHIEIVKKLLKVDPTLCLVKGREMMIALHCAAMAGTVNVLHELLLACPDSVKELTVKDETALHLALKSDKIDAFKVFIQQLQPINKIIKNIKMSDWLKEMKVLKWKDFEGNTVLHLALLRNHHEAIRMLFDLEKQANKCQVFEIQFNHPPWTKTVKVVDVEMVNAENLSALDIILQRQEANLEVEYMDQLAASHIRVHAPFTKILNFFLFLVLLIIHFSSFRFMESISENVVMEEKNALLVVVGLIATTTFQVGVNPPGGFWQETNLTSTDDPSHDPSHAAGTSILYTTQPIFFGFFMNVNVIAFTLAYQLLIALAKGLPFKIVLRLALLFTWLCYIYSLTSIADGAIPSVLVLTTFNIFYATFISSMVQPMMQKVLIRKFKAALSGSSTARRFPLPF